MGSFPPLPSSAAAATVAIVRRELESGRTVVTASPRPSAASLVLRLTGPLGAWRLERVRRSCGAAKLVLSVEPGWPLPPAISVVLHRFADVSLLVSEPTFAVLRVVRRLRRVAEVVLAGQAGRPEVVAAVALAVPEVPLRVVAVPPLGTPVVGITPLGPRERVSSRSHLPGTGGGRGLLGPSADSLLQMEAAWKKGALFLRRGARRAVSDVRKMTTGGP